MQVSFLNSRYFNNFSLFSQRQKGNFEQSIQNPVSLPSYKASRAYARINFGRNFSTVEGYKALLPAQIKKLRGLVAQRLEQNEVYSSDEGLQTLEKLTNHILNLEIPLSLTNNIPTQVKNHRIVSLGRSPIPILEMAKALGKIENYVFIAFSKGKELVSVNSQTWLEKGCKSPTMEQLLKYKKYLTDLGMNPQSIIKKANEGQKTVIIDYCQWPVGGMYSFLEILRDWALEHGNYNELKRSVIAIPMSGWGDVFFEMEMDEYYNKKDLSKSLLQSFNAELVNIHDSISETNMDYISSHVANTGFEKPYSCENWESSPPTRGPEKGHELNSALAKFAIIDYLARKGLLK